MLPPGWSPLQAPLQRPVLLRHLHTHHLPSHDILGVSPQTKSAHAALADTDTRQGAYLLRAGTLSKFADTVEQFLELIDIYAKK